MKQSSLKQETQQQLVAAFMTYYNLWLHCIPWHVGFMDAGHAETSMGFSYILESDCCLGLVRRQWRLIYHTPRAWHVITSLQQQMNYAQG
ncbi:hypothetical protein M9H77_32226 [Catharanthus roseus]|uniref:Uncharacterized protein n=1 Tax=Catharanthus roseus TaxID=4058 RepID=A0ACC0A368_CATRO|nr:hypothetical protein M9H77_32226 [Catharanthus roseus]